MRERTCCCVRARPSGMDLLGNTKNKLRGSGKIEKRRTNLIGRDRDRKTKIEI